MGWTALGFLTEPLSRLNWRGPLLALLLLALAIAYVKWLHVQIDAADARAEAAGAREAIAAEALRQQNAAIARLHTETLAAQKRARDAAARAAAKAREAEAAAEALMQSQYPDDCEEALAQAMRDARAR